MSRSLYYFENISNIYTGTLLGYEIENFILVLLGQPVSALYSDRQLICDPLWNLRCSTFLCGHLSSVEVYILRCDDHADIPVSRVSLHRPELFIFNHSRNDRLWSRIVTFFWLAVAGREPVFSHGKPAMKCSFVIVLFYTLNHRIMRDLISTKNYSVINSRAHINRDFSVHIVACRYYLLGAVY